MCGYDVLRILLQRFKGQASETAKKWQFCKNIYILTRPTWNDFCVKLQIHLYPEIFSAEDKVGKLTHNKANTVRDKTTS